MLSSVQYTDSHIEVHFFLVNSSKNPWQRIDSAPEKSAGRKENEKEKESSRGNRTQEFRNAGSGYGNGLLGDEDRRIVQRRY